MRPMLRFEPLLLALCLVVLSSGCNAGAGRIDTACRSNDDCATTELCATGLCENGLGECFPVPESCEDTVSYVCGCDGRTYDNDCLASQARVRLASPVPCACADNTECVEGQYCALDDSCLDVGGCLPEPESCDPSDTQEVCGCDGTTYANECSAFQSGVRVSALGACDCATNDDCAGDEYCNAITCDGPGLCVARTDCEANREVVGCDGVVYQDACAAAAAGVRVRP